jgi:arylsulfatase A-like enzyme
MNPSHPPEVSGQVVRQTRCLLLLRCLLATLMAATSPALKAQQPPTAGPSSAASRPNIVLLLADDFGYGDASCYNTEARVRTQHIDQLAQAGLQFTDAHSPATVCTPSRYGLLTGQMPFRIPRGGVVFTGTGGPSLIAPGRLTLARLLQQQGYATWAVGKWHLGLTFRDAAGQPLHDGRPETVARIDYSRPVEGGPLEHGFDRFFGTACCPTTDWLYAFIDGNRIPVPPTTSLDKSTLPRHPWSHDCRAGLIAPNFPMESIDQVFLQQSRRILEEHLQEHPEQPFFLYHATQAVHLPSFPSSQFQGRSGCGPHGDFLMELDDIVGQLTEILRQHGVLDNTLFIFTSDNGPETSTVVSMRKEYNHDGARPWRGLKRDNWEGGHRVPLLLRWPAVISPGTRYTQPASLTDLMATIAQILAVELPADAAEDSFSLLPALQGPTTESLRPWLVTQAFRGRQTLSIRRGQWKYLDHAGSGGNNYDTDLLREYRPATNDTATSQLYNLQDDPLETTNLITQQPALASEMKLLLQNTLKSGRSRPAGPATP